MADVPASIWIAQCYGDDDQQVVVAFSTAEKADAWTDTLGEDWGCVIYQLWVDDPDALTRRTM